MKKNKAKAKKTFYKRVWFWLLAFIVIFMGIELMCSGSDSSLSSKFTIAKKKPDPFKKVYSVGQTASYKGYEVKVNSVKFNKGDNLNTPKSGKQYVIANVTITNKTKKSQDYNEFDFKLNADGNNTNVDELNSSVNNTLSSGTLDKGASVTGNLVGQADVNAKKLQLQCKTTFWNEKAMKFNLK